MENLLTLIFMHLLHHKMDEYILLQSEDTLSGIARREFGDSRYWPFIWLNNINLCHGYDSIILTLSLLTPGKVIKLPDKRLVIEWVRRHRLPGVFFNSFSSDLLFWCFYLYMHNQDPKNIPDPFSALRDQSIVR